MCVCVGGGGGGNALVGGINLHLNHPWYYFCGGGGLWIFLWLDPFFCLFVLWFLFKKKNLFLCFSFFYHVTDLFNVLMNIDNKQIFEREKFFIFSSLCCGNK